MTLSAFRTHQKPPQSGPSPPAPKSGPAPSSDSPAIGRNVRELRDKIQQQLSKREVKKPAGGVDVGGEAPVAAKANDADGGKGK